MSIEDEERFIPTTDGQLEMIPTILSNNFDGYQHFMDPTVMPFNMLTYPSQNCNIPNHDKIVPDLGKTLVGQLFTQDQGIIGNKKKYTTSGGAELEVRVWNSVPYVLYTGLTGTFVRNETITGGSSGHTAKIVSIDTMTEKLILTLVTGAFTVGETITGGISGAHATVSFDFTTYADVIEILYTDTNPSGAHFNTPWWYQITENVNPLPKGLHRYSMDSWFDADLNPSESLNVPRLVWVNGNAQIYSWTGGIAPIISLVANTSITTTSGITWTSLGFVDPALGGTGNIIINGIAYVITGGWNTDTLTLTNTSGISVNNLAFSQIQADSPTATGPLFQSFDYCRQVNNYMYYGYWKSKSLYQSNALSYDPTQLITNVQAVQNDLVVAPVNYSGTGTHIYRVTIDQAYINQQAFLPGGGGSLNDGVFNTSGYSGGTTAVPNIYNALIVADFTIDVPTAGGSYTLGEVLEGGTSKATARLVNLVVNGSNDQMGVVIISGVFQNGEAIVGQNSATSKTASFTAYQNWIQLFKNGVLTTIHSGPFTGTTVPLLGAPNQTLTLVDGLTITFQNYYGHAVGDSFQLTINSSTAADTFQWQIDGGIPIATGVPITGGNQVLQDNITISFVNVTGHTLGDFWEITAAQGVTKAWTNFYYTLQTTPQATSSSATSVSSGRTPGQGYIFDLPSNFWTMDIQEDTLYVNTQYGEWGTITTQTATTLITETVVYTPLKQAGALKAIDPWMTGHLEDDLMFVTIDKALMDIGRKQFLQKPQDTYLSDPVKLDFLASSFVGGSIEYIGKKLYISSPSESITHCYDLVRNYWQPPKTFPEMGILSIVGDNLFCHSNIRNQSFSVFTNQSDNGSEYLVMGMTPSTAYFKLVARKRIPGNWDKKYTGATFLEGYYSGGPEIKAFAATGVQGDEGFFPHDVIPKLSNIPDRSSIGAGALGSHPLASDSAITGTHFYEIYTGYKPILNYYYLSLGFSCISTNHTYQILAMGANLAFAPDGNNELVNQEEIINSMI